MACPRPLLLSLASARSHKVAGTPVFPSTFATTHVCSWPICDCQIPAIPLSVEMVLSPLAGSALAVTCSEGLLVARSRAGRWRAQQPELSRSLWALPYSEMFEREKYH